MKVARLLCRLSVVALALTSSLFAAGRKDRTVVVISLDGFPAYALDDPRLPIPTLRKLALEGVSAASMQPINPTVTWPNHTALVTGVDASEHQVLFNGLLTPHGAGTQPSIEPWRDKNLLVHAPTIYDAAYQAGFTTAQVDWVAIHGAKTITWQFPELPDPNGVIEQEMIADGTVTPDQLRTFENSSQAWQDQMWTDAAVKILEKHKPNLLLFHLLSLDDASHAYGPMSGPSFTAMALLDSCVKQIVNALQRTSDLQNASLIIVSDHGFRSVKHKLHPNVLLRESGLLTDFQGQLKGDAWVMPTGGTAMVYVTNPDRKQELLPRLRALFSQAEGVAQVYGADQFHDLGLPTPAASTQAPDLVLAAAPEYEFSGEAGSDYVRHVSSRGTHGYLNTDPNMQAIFIAWGAGIPSGVRMDKISNLDVAPTVAALLGIEMKGAKGHAIAPIVNSSPRH